MHDPSTLAFSIRAPWKESVRLKDGSIRKTDYRPSLVDIWHIDPESDGTDDSCGWFKRSRHGDKKILKAIENSFDFDWCASWGGWFHESGNPRLSVSSIVLEMFFKAAYEHFGRNRDKAVTFCKEHLFDILHFSENTTDSLFSAITNQYGHEKKECRIEHCASVIYGCILRWSQPWYRHARWHVWHWRFRFPYFRGLFKRADHGQQVNQ